ncbi:MAG: hypothetical protein NC548_43295 [Lachnospiraceae bacterium]|nr:hypothetical protein [Lachnospiraceae bacterium]
MTEKENLIYEMKSLMKTLEKYLKELDTGEIDETAYQLLDADMYTLLVALRIYFGEAPFAGQQIILLAPED